MLEDRLYADAEIAPFQAPYYKATVTRVVDGDTFDAVIDVGFDVKVVARIRLNGVDTPEVRGEERAEGLKAKERVREIMQKAVNVVIRSEKGGSRGSFNRWLADVFYPVGIGWKCLGPALITEGLAEEYRRR